MHDRPIQTIALAAACLFVAFGAPSPAAGEDLRISSARVEVPGGWRPIDAPPGLAAAAERERPAAARVRIEAGRLAANLSLCVRSRYLEVSPRRIEAARRRIHAEMLALRGPSEPFRIEDLRIVEVNGLPAYRVRAILGEGPAEVSQLQYLVAGGETAILTFSAPARSYEAEEPGFEGIARSLRIERRPDPASAMPPWLCGSAIGIVAGIVLASRRSRKGLHFPRSVS